MLPNPAAPRSMVPDHLQSILNNPAYFGHCPELFISENIVPLAYQALEEIERQLIPISHERLQQVIGRLLMHFGGSAKYYSHQSLMSHYTQQLGHFPEDLVCAAYIHLLRYHPYQSAPSIGDIVCIITPELQRRNHIKQQLNTLLEPYARLQQKNVACTKPVRRHDEVCV